MQFLTSEHLSGNYGGNSKFEYVYGTLIHRLSSASESADCQRRIWNELVQYFIITSEFEVDQQE